MFTNKWDKMPIKKQKSLEKRLVKAARNFYSMKKKTPYASSVFMYYINKFVIRKYMGVGSYPFEYWKENGYFDKCPF